MCKANAGIKKGTRRCLLIYLPFFGGGADGLRSGACVSTEPARLFAALVADGWLRTLPARLERDGEDFSFLDMVVSRKG
jgi:hypothetical protein